MRPVRRRSDRRRESRNWRDARRTRSTVPRPAFVSARVRDSAVVVTPSVPVGSSARSRIVPDLAAPLDGKQKPSRTPASVSRTPDDARSMTQLPVDDHDEVPELDVADDRVVAPENRVPGLQSNRSGRPPVVARLERPSRPNSMSPPIYVRRGVGKRRRGLRVYSLAGPRRWPRSSETPGRRRQSFSAPQDAPGVPHPLQLSSGCGRPLRWTG